MQLSIPQFYLTSLEVKALAHHLGFDNASKRDVLMHMLKLWDVNIKAIVKEYKAHMVALAEGGAS